MFVRSVSASKKKEKETDFREGINAWKEFIAVIISKGGER